MFCVGVVTIGISPAGAQEVSSANQNINPWAMQQKLLEMQIQQYSDIVTWNAAMEHNRLIKEAVERLNVAYSKRPTERKQTVVKPKAQVKSKSQISTGTGRCGGNLPPCSVMMCESGGSLTAHNSSGADGKWQIMPGTWSNYKGYSSPSSAPEVIQDERAAQIYAGGAGRSAWSC